MWNKLWGSSNQCERAELANETIKCERKAELRNMYKKAKRKIEDQCAENSVER